MSHGLPGGTTRRAFIGGTVATAAALSTRPLVTAGSERTAEVWLAGMAADADAAAIGSAVRAAAVAATDFSWLARGDTVALKPAWNSGNPYPFTSHPVGVAAMVGLLRERGAGRVLLIEQAGVEHVRRTFDGLTGSSRTLWAEHGLYGPALAAGAELVPFEEASWGDHFLADTPAGSHWREGIWLPRALREVDHLVFLPRVGSHVLAGASLGFKSAVGWLRDDSRLELHRDADTFFEKIAEIASSPVIRGRLRLALSVAHRVVSTFGPDRGYVATPETGLVIASTDLVAHDLAALSWCLAASQRLTPQAELARDPRNMVTATINQRFVGRTWGEEAAAAATALPKAEVRRAIDDPMIRHAATLWGGTPDISWRPVERDLPGSIVDRLVTYAG